MRVLISAGADVSAATETGDTPLHDAASYGKTDIVRVLISAGADVRAKDAHGNTPLHVAAMNGHTETVRVLGSEWGDSSMTFWERLRFFLRFGYTV